MNSTVLLGERISLPLTRAEMIEKWTDPADPIVFAAGMLYDGDADPPCRCVQGEILHLAGIPDDALESMDRDHRYAEADQAVGILLGEDAMFARMLRTTNDHVDSPVAPWEFLETGFSFLGDRRARVLQMLDFVDRSEQQLTDAAIPWFLIKPELPDEIFVQHIVDRLRSGMTDERVAKIRFVTRMFGLKDESGVCLTGCLTGQRQFLLGAILETMSEDQDAPYFLPMLGLRGTGDSVEKI